MKRLLDIFLSFFGILFLLPLFFITGVSVAVSSTGGAFFFQQRVGKKEKVFLLAKFRTMLKNAEKEGQLTTSDTDARITSFGKILRKFKLDELPQLFNVLVGDMSLVGPRPEVPKYVALYNEEQKQVLSIRPGMTSLASIEYSKENELLAKAENPEEKYIREIMPAKLALDLQYVKEKSFLLDLKIILKTILEIVR